MRSSINSTHLHVLLCLILALSSLTLGAPLSTPSTAAPTTAIELAPRGLPTHCWGQTRFGDGWLYTPGPTPGHPCPPSLQPGAAVGNARVSVLALVGSVFLVLGLGVLF